jgi:hypothetical protein
VLEFAGQLTVGGVVSLTVTVAVPLIVIGQPFTSVPLAVYVVVLEGVTVKLNGPAPFIVPPPLSSETVYGAVPPLTLTLMFAELPGQMV